MVIQIKRYLAYGLSVIQINTNSVLEHAISFFEHQKCLGKQNVRAKYLQSIFTAGNVFHLKFLSIYSFNLESLCTMYPRGHNHWRSHDFFNGGGGGGKARERSDTVGRGCVFWGAEGGQRV